MDFTRILTISLFSTLLLVGCDSPSGQSDDSVQSDKGQTDNLAVNKVTSDFICSHLLITTDLSGNNITLTIEDKSYQLSQTSSDSGNKYTNESNEITFWQKGEVATLNLKGQQYSDCQKVNIQRSANVKKQIKLPFTARGNEPGWMLTINKDQLELVADYGETTLTASVANAPFIETGRSSHFETSEGKLTLLAEDKLCYDSMSGMPYPYSISIQIEQETLTGCGGEPRSLLTQNSWSVLTIADTMLVQDSRILLNFTPEEQLTGIASCNRYTTSYTLTGESLSISPIATTRMACEPALMKQEAHFLKHLANVTRFGISDTGQLVLYTEQDATIKAQPADS